MERLIRKIFQFWSSRGLTAGSTFWTPRSSRGVTVTALCFVFLLSCGSDRFSQDGPAGVTPSGTEVNNPVNPEEIPQKKFEGEIYSIYLTIPPDWTYQEYDLEDVPGPEVFKDTATPHARVMAHFIKENRGYFTVFEGIKEPGKTLVAYIRDRRSVGTIKSQIIDDSPPATMAIIYQREAGTHGGLVFDMYVGSDSEEGVLWMRVELVGSSEEKQATWNSFWDIVSTARIVHGNKFEQQLKALRPLSM